MVRVNITLFPYMVLKKRYIFNPVSPVCYHLTGVLSDFLN